LSDPGRIDLMGLSVPTLGVDAARTRLASMIFERVAGADGPQRRDRIHDTPGERWFAEDSVIRQVHADASMFVGGLRALLLQSLHPLAMAGVAQHSDYRGDPWGRLQRTSYFLAVTTFGTRADAERAVAAVRSIHERVRGTAADGRPYRANDPHLLRWVHVAEVDSFLTAYQRFSGSPLDRLGRDAYVADTARVATALGIDEPPRSEAELADQLAGFRPELKSTPEARDAARYLLLKPPVPWIVRPPVAVLQAAAVASLPSWARWPLRLPFAPVAEATIVQASGRAFVRTIGWVMAPTGT
jgi:uncharacterized protein (DUF2236 family)